MRAAAPPERTEEALSAALMLGFAGGHVDACT
jgi:hypothetical protein